VSTMTCLSCGAATSNGLALCELCQRKARVDLEFLPVYFRNLARWRPGRAGSRQVPGSRVLYDGDTRGTGDRIGDALDEARNSLTTWARLITEDRPDFPRPLTHADALLAGELPASEVEGHADDPAALVALLCAALDQHLISIATREWAGEFARTGHREDDKPDGIGHHEQRLRTLTETLVPGWYAGACMRIVTMEGSECGGSTYVVPGLTWANCTRCGATTYARDHLAVILDEARGWVAPPKRLAEAIVALVDGELSVPRLYDRIRQWASRGDLKPIHRTVRDYVYDDDADALVVANVQTGRARYRFGEAFDLLASDTPASSAVKAS